MKHPFVHLLAAASIGLCGCTGGSAAESTAPLWTFENHAQELRDLSCPDGTEFQRPDSLVITASDIDRGSLEARQENLSGLTLSGAWHLQADSDAFGGLSGLDVLESGSLLAVTDDGKFVWIGIDAETGAPDGMGSIAKMRDEDGNVFPRKRDADAEDLVWRDGLAFVSFEQEHRIEAYDIERCGVAARAARVVNLSKRVDGRKLNNNQGAEALSFDGNTLKVGFETHFSGGSPVGQVRVDGHLAQRQQTEQPALFLLTGMDIANGLTAYVFRAYDPIRGARVIVQIERDGERIGEASLRSPLPTDNFEAIAIDETSDGRTRIWLLSDDNFNKNQRTLLLALDLTS